MIFKGWKDFVWETKLDVGDILVFKYQEQGFKLRVFKFMTSTE